MRRRIPGFTLIELMVAMAAGTILIAVGLDGFTRVASIMNVASKSLEGDEDAKLLNEYLVAQLQGLGGNGSRPWQSVTVENGFNSAGDRLTIFELDTTMPECSVAATDWTGSNLFFTMDASCADDDCGTTCYKCCFDRDCDGDADLDVMNMNVLVVDASGHGLMGVGHNFNTSGGVCKVNFPGGLQPAGITAPSDSTIPDPTFMEFGIIKRYWVDPTTHILKFSQYTPSDGSLVESQLSDRIYSFHVALGYDLAPIDGVVIDAASTTDEWKFNATGTDTLTTAAADELRMIQVGLVVAAPGKKNQNYPAVKVLDGTAVAATGWMMIPVVGKAFMRNLDYMY